MESFIVDDIENLNSELEKELFGYYDQLDSDNEKNVRLPEYLIEELRSNFNSNYAKNFHARGGSKEIFRVRDPHTSRDVALAKLKEGASVEQMERFLNEARITAALEHPSIMPIYDIGLDENEKPFFTMKFLHDQSLHKIIYEMKEKNSSYTDKFDQAILLDFYVKICEAISYAHSRGIIHLDLKPENVMIGEYGEVYVCDWGLAKVLNESDNITSEFNSFDIDFINDFTLNGVIKGTPGYMAPEQVATNIGPRDRQTDIYALGAILYAILTYNSPYCESSKVEMLKATIRGKLPSPQKYNIKVADSLNAIVLKAIAVEKSDRYETVQEIIDDIKAYQAGFATSAENASFLKALLLLIKRHKTAATLLSLLFIFVISMTVTLKQRSDKLQQALNLYNQEKSVREELLIKATPALLSRWYSEMPLLDFDWLHQQLDEIIRFNPDNGNAKLIKSYLYFSQLNFNKALAFAERLPKPAINKNTLTVKALVKLCRKSIEKNGYITVNTILKCFQTDHFGEYNQHVSRLFAASAFSQLKSDSEKSDLVKQVLRFCGYKGKTFPDNCITTSPDGIVTLDLSGIPITTLWGADFLPIHRWILKNSQLKHYPSTGNKTVEFVDFTGCRLKALRGLKNSPNLKEAILPSNKRNSSIANTLKLKGVKCHFVD